MFQVLATAGPEVQVKLSVLQESPASSIMWWPEFVPQITGGAGPSELAWNCAVWHCVRPFGLLSPVDSVLG